MAVAILKPNDRYAIVGKTGSGKTQFAAVLAAHFAQAIPKPWEIWWIDTKNDKTDIALLRSWGFCNGASEKDKKRPGALNNAFYYQIMPITHEGYTFSVVDLAQAKIKEAYDRKHVIIVVDEYTQVCPSRISEGYALRDVFTRGRGRNVGLIGLTQEPVYVPRKLISQASHLGLFSVSFLRDIKYLREFCDTYRPPIRMGDKYGFYWSHVDGAATWAYYQNMKEWYEHLNIAKPKQEEVKPKPPGLY